MAKSQRRSASPAKDRKEEPSAEELERRTRWFEGYMEQLERSSTVSPPKLGEKYKCSCCGFFTLAERGGFDICKVCFWEDDGQDDHDADLIRGGPNGRLSLAQARLNFLACGACEERFKANVRGPKESEKPSAG